MHARFSPLPVSLARLALIVVLCAVLPQARAAPLTAQPALEPGPFKIVKDFGDTIYPGSSLSSGGASSFDGAVVAGSLAYFQASTPDSGARSGAATARRRARCCSKISVPARATSSPRQGSPPWAQPYTSTRTTAHSGRSCGRATGRRPARSASRISTLGATQATLKTSSSWATSSSSPPATAQGSISGRATAPRLARRRPS